MSRRSTMNEYPQQVETSTGSPIRAMAFTTSGKYLVTGDKEAVRMWKVVDNRLELIEPMLKAKDVRCVAVSRDGKWIAAGKSWGEMTVWNRSTFEEVFTHESGGHTVTSVDFSPDSTRLVTASGNRKAYVFDVATRKVVVKPLEHQYWVTAAKYSPEGDRIATVTFRDAVRVYDSHNGDLLVTIQVKVTPYYNTGLLWSNESILILSNNSISRINLPGTSVDLEWTVEDSNYPSIVSPESGAFILHSLGYEIRFYSRSPSIQSQSPIQLQQDAHAMAVSPDGQLLAIGGVDGKLIVKNLVEKRLKRSKSPRT